MINYIKNFDSSSSYFLINMKYIKMNQFIILQLLNVIIYQFFRIINIILKSVRIKFYYNILYIVLLIQSKIANLTYSVYDNDSHFLHIFRNIVFQLTISITLNNLIKKQNLHNNCQQYGTCGGIFVCQMRAAVFRSPKPCNRKFYLHNLFYVQCESFKMETSPANFIFVIRF